MSPADLEAFADLVADRLAERLTAPPRIVDAAGMAAYLGVSRETVYEHADRLGAIRLGSGERPRLRFVLDAPTIERWRDWGSERPPEPKPRRTRVPLLPVGRR